MRVLALLALLVPSVACDQVTKMLAVDHLKGAGTIHVVDGLFRLTYAENPGAFLGLGTNLPHAIRIPIFVVLALGFVIGAAVFVARQKKIAPALFVAVALLAAGAAGNVIDRVMREGSRVVDFAVLGVKTPFGRVQTGVFNVADIYIMVGAGLVVLASLRKKDDEDAPREPAPAPPASA
jgi:signal peptidase II